MSGILLPGQDKRPQGEEQGQGLVLPGSAGRKREEARKPEAAPAAVPAAAETPPAPRRRLSAEDLAFPPTGAQVQCPSCGTPFAVPVFSIIDLGANPELKQALLGGQINVAQCPNCGAGGMLSAPLMVHVPEKQWLGVFIPGESRGGEAQRQKIIGDLTQTLMRKTPQEQRKGYFLQPRQYMDWERFVEQLWEFEGVSAETLRRQRAQSDFLQSLLGLANDRKALEIALARSGDLVDRTFFAMLDRIYLMVDAQGASQEAQQFAALRAALLELTPAGKEVAAHQDRIRGVLTAIKPETTRDDLVQLLLDTWAEKDGRDVVAAVIMGVPNLFDYQFLLSVNERLEKSESEADKVALDEMRRFVLSAQQQIEQSRQASAQQSQQLLQEVLGSTDVEGTLRANLELVDEMFLSLLAGTMQQAERNQSLGAARRLKQIYDTAIRILQEGMPAEMQLINQLLIAADNKAQLNAMIDENRALLTPQFVESLRSVETEMRDTGRAELADRVKSIRAILSLKV